MNTGIDVDMGVRMYKIIGTVQYKLANQHNDWYETTFIRDIFATDIAHAKASVLEAFYNENTQVGFARWYNPETVRCIG